MTKVKICGITNLEDARHAVECGADMLGFNFYRESKRYIEPHSAAKIAQGLAKAGVALAGVFVNAEPGEIARIVNDVGLHAVQLHGDETPDFVRLLGALLPAVEIIKAFRVEKGFSTERLAHYVSHRTMLDGAAGVEYGGAGKTFPWAIATNVEDLILAGGLNADNVGEAIRTAQPYAVDVASGVESAPGKKDPAKVAAFIRAAKEAI